MGVAEEICLIQPPNMKTLRTAFVIGASFLVRAADLARAAQP